MNNQKNFFYKKHKFLKGFTLIEMILVVTIIAILATSVLMGLGGARMSARNARRLADLKNLQNALELYYNRMGQYCTSQGWSNLDNCLRNAGVITKTPNDPLSSTGSSSTWRYDYRPCGTANQGYLLGARMERANSSDTSVIKDSVSSITVGGTTCNSLPNLGQCNTCPASDYCIYCVAP